MYTLAQLSDQADIAQLLQRYFTALDTKDYALLDMVFLPDARLRYDVGQDVTLSYPEMKEQFRRFLERFCFTQHLMGPPTIDLDGDTARSTNVVRAHHVERAADGREGAWTVYGVYRDVHARTGAGWRIRERYFQGQHVAGALLPDAPT
jgi:hypothetical protein